MKRNQEAYIRVAMAVIGKVDQVRGEIGVECLSRTKSQYEANTRLDPNNFSNP